MPASIEHFSSIIRVGPQHTKYGDPYDFAVTIRWLSPQEVEVIGLVSDKFNAAGFVAIRNALARCGVTKAWWRRKVGDKAHEFPVFESVERLPATIPQPH